ncbi:CYFA0S01e11892g1_1 [Cyberlindnera fabianii]|uniref:CYFA0S01e11892g1_1 n=1 Tax=Cyberlindnera fabianii TaxID=36022 RepID=A0A061AQD1_CYBFA|nr:CYFA0S01e11892g1_1 [Cyberlindnera fabianii]
MRSANRRPRPQRPSPLAAHASSPGGTRNAYGSALAHQSRESSPLASGATVRKISDAQTPAQQITEDTTSATHMSNDHDSDKPTTTITSTEQKDQPSLRQSSIKSGNGEYEHGLSTRRSSDQKQYEGLSISIEGENKKQEKEEDDGDEEEEEEEEEESEEGEYPKSYQMPPQLLEKLSRFPLFKNAPPSFHKAIASRLQLMTVHAQEYIVKFGEPAKAMYWILRGSVAVTSPDGEAVHAELVAGQFFGEIGILFNRPRTATVIARTKVLLGVLTADSFNAVLPDFPAVERMIRDEAQERLSMQDKRKRNGVTNILSNAANNTPTIMDKADLDMRASEVATAASNLPGPSVPPKVRSPSPALLPDVLGSFASGLHKDVQFTTRESLPQIHDNVDHSIPTRDFLRSMPMFTLLPSAIIHELVLGVEPRRFEPFEYIVKKGELGRDIFFVVNGEVEVLDPKRISLATSEGDKDKKVDRVLGRLGPGQYFGEMAFLESLSDGKEKIERSADIRSVSTVDVLIVTGDQLENLYSRYPRICDEMRETATKRINKNKDHAEAPDQHEHQETPFGKWKGFQTSVAQLNDPVFSPTATTNNASRNDISIRPPREGSPTSTISESTLMTGNGPSTFNSFSTVNSFHFDDQKHPQLKRRRSTVSANRSQLAPPDPLDTTQPPLTMHLPPMNPVVPSVSSFPSAQRQPPPFQYMPHAKRLRLASISGRRRSSVLSTGVLPDRILLRVFSFLSLPELMKLRIICRRWRQLLYVAPGFFEHLDLRPYNTSIDDKALIQITDFVGSRPKTINMSNCFHVTDVGFCYMVNEIGISGSITVIKMSSVWEVSAMAIMDLAVPSVGRFIEELDLSNCGKTRDDVIERIIGWKKRHNSGGSSMLNAANNGQAYLDSPVPGMEEFDGIVSNESAVGCPNLKRLNLGYCKHLTDRSMYHIALHANDRLESLDITRCTTITDAGFAYWAYQPFPNLKKLKMSDCTFLTDKSLIAIASSAQFLEDLDLSFCCALTDVSIEVICLGCPNLTHLDLSFCGSAISDSTLLAISIHLRNLKSLVVKGCVRVTRAGADALLSNSVSLRYLDISQCRNAHFYRDNSPAMAIAPTPNSRSAFVTTAHGNVVEIVI